MSNCLSFVIFPQNFKNVLQLIKEAFFKHGEKEALRSCLKAIDLCCTESPGDLQDFSRNKLKELEDELFEKLKHAMRKLEVYRGDIVFLVPPPLDIFLLACLNLIVCRMVMMSTPSL